MQHKIILGTVQFGLEYGINNSTGKPGMKDISSILDFAYENNIRLLDTAEAYGTSQNVIGEYHKTVSHKFDIVTKFSSKQIELPENLRERIVENLKTLNHTFLYGYMFHSFSDFENYYPIYKNQIDTLKKEGLIKKFGVSIYTNAEFEKLLQYDNIDIVQLPFNLLDNESKRQSLLKKSKEKGIEVHTRSVFLQGLFFKPIKDLPQNLITLQPYLTKIKAISDASNISIADVSLNYALSQNDIDYVLIGVDTLEQLIENIKSTQTQIPVDVIDQINSIDVKEVELLNPANWTK